MAVGDVKRAQKNRFGIYRASGDVQTSHELPYAVYGVASLRPLNGSERCVQNMVKRYPDGRQNQAARRVVFSVANVMRCVAEPGGVCARRTECMRYSHGAT